MRDPITLEADSEAESEQVVTTGDIVDWRTRADPVVRKSPAPIELADLQEVSPAPIRQTEAPRYLTRRLLGKGGMGEVRLCKDFRIGRSVAMKVLHADAAADADAQLRFVQEAQIQGQLEHPAIPPVYDLGLAPDGTLFFTMKRLRGRTLAEILRGLRAGQPALLQQFSLQRLLESFLTVCRAVQYAHTRGILHRVFNR
jgi:serine/threonine-protein kinase